jgi:hypothetical protein
MLINRTSRRTAALGKSAAIAACICLGLCHVAFGQGNIEGDVEGVNGTRAGFEIDNNGVLFCGDGPNSFGPPGERLPGDVHPRRQLGKQR